MGRYRKKPVIVEAIRWTGRNASDIRAFVPHKFLSWSIGHNPIIRTSGGSVLAYEGDWIIRGVKGEFYPCQPNVFAATYEKVHDDIPLTKPLD